MLTGNIFLEKFRRVSSQRYMPEIDGLRFLAIIPVILLHFRTSFLRYNDNYDIGSLSSMSKTIDKFILTGDVGVPVFFAISGFILSLPFANHYINNGKKVNVKRYFFRRLTRLEPPYIITLIIFYIVHVALQTNPLKDLTASLFASLIYSHNWIFGTWSIINPVAWSLEIEVQFYILVPLLTILFAVKNRLFRSGLLLLLLLLFPVLNYILKVPFLSLIGFGQYFIVGIIVADIYLSNKTLNINKNIFDIAGVISVVLIFVLKFYKIYFFLPVVIFVVFLSAIYGNILNKIFSNRFVSIIGGMCYITYLIHYSLFTGIMMIFPDVSLGLGYWPDFILYGAIIIPMVIISSAFAFLVLEKPFMDHNWPHRFHQFIINIKMKKK